MNVGVHLHSVYDAVLNFIYPPCCYLCGLRLDTPEEVVCPACAALIRPVAAPFCERCGTPSAAAGEGCAACAGRTFHFIRARTAMVFDETAQRMIHLLKYRGRRAVGRYLGRRLADALMQETWYPDIDMLIPMPLHRTRQRERGYNQSEILARSLAAETALPVHANLVIRRRHTRSQTTLTPEQRLENVRGVFQAPDTVPLQGKHIALIDDVLTTGATLDSCAQALLDAGAAAVYALAVARA